MSDHAGLGLGIVGVIVAIASYALVGVPLEKRIARWLRKRRDHCCDWDPETGHQPGCTADCPECGRKRHDHAATCDVPRQIKENRMTQHDSDNTDFIDMPPRAENLRYHVNEHGVIDRFHGGGTVIVSGVRRHIHGAGLFPPAHGVEDALRILLKEGYLVLAPRDHADVGEPAYEVARVSPELDEHPDDKDRPFIASFDSADLKAPPIATLPDGVTAAGGWWAPSRPSLTAQMYPSLVKDHRAEEQILALIDHARALRENTKALEQHRKALRKSQR